MRRAGDGELSKQEKRRTGEQENRSAGKQAGRRVKEIVQDGIRGREVIRGQKGGGEAEQGM
jgi:hypothetical protein